ncbi:MAG: hypothetical protein KDA24_29705 [Deltaproteobacteria bacterium]|nr:hypothetical protein [Deltaproteobacteria bacterium]
MPALLLHVAATLFMTGLIWFVQVVHYPLAARVGEAAFPAYQAAHMRMTGWVVGPPMLLELAMTGLLVVARPEGIPAWAPWLGAALLAVVWASTAFLQVPAHEALLAGSDPRLVDRLVQGNWVRTAAWTARAGLALAMVAWAAR